MINKITQAVMNTVSVSFAASDEMSGDGEIASVMGFSGFGMYTNGQKCCIFNFIYDKLKV